MSLIFDVLYFILGYYFGYYVTLLSKLTNFLTKEGGGGGLEGGFERDKLPKPIPSMIKNGTSLQTAVNIWQKSC